MPLSQQKRGQTLGRNGLFPFDLDAAVAHGALLDLTRRSNFDDASFVDDSHPIAQPFGLLDVVGGQENGALSIAQFLDQAVNLQAYLGI